LTSRQPLSESNTNTKSFGQREDRFNPVSNGSKSFFNSEAKFHTSAGFGFMVDGKVNTQTFGGSNSQSNGSAVNLHNELRSSERNSLADGRPVRGSQQNVPAMGSKMFLKDKGNGGDFLNVPSPHGDRRRLLGDSARNK
jgi:hypothetical protein